MNNLIQAIDISTVFVYTIISMVEVAEFLLANEFKFSMLEIYLHIKYIIFKYISEQYVYNIKREFPI